MVAMRELRRLFAGRPTSLRSAFALACPCICRRRRPLNVGRQTLGSRLHKSKLSLDSYRLDSRLAIRHFSIWLGIDLLAIPQGADRRLVPIKTRPNVPAAL